MVMLGAPCDLPASYAPIPGTIDSSGVEINMPFYPYTMVDDLTLTEARDQVLIPVTSTGRVCTNNVVLTATPPAGATGHQWYRHRGADRYHAKRFRSRPSRWLVYAQQHLRGAMPHGQYQRVEPGRSATGHRPGTGLRLRAAHRGIQRYHWQRHLHRLVEFR